MSELAGGQCEACRVGAPQVTETEQTELLSEIPEWQIITRDGIKMLERQYKFRNFKLALEFTNQIGALAEAQGHHPEILTSWGMVSVTWWTHKIKGLHKNDFIMAAKSDKLYTE